MQLLGSLHQLQLSLNVTLLFDMRKVRYVGMSSTLRVTNPN